jgi:hypothetical protein
MIYHLKFNFETISNTEVFFLCQVLHLIYEHSNISNFHCSYNNKLTASVVWRSEFLAANPEVPGSISGATRFSEWQWV